MIIVDSCAWFFLDSSKRYLSVLMQYGCVKVRNRRAVQWFSE